MLSLSFPENGFKYYFQSFTTFVFQVKVVSKAFSGMFPMTNFAFIKFSTIFLAFPRNGFNFVTQKFAKKWKLSFLKAENIFFDLKIASKKFSKILPMINFRFKQFSLLCPTFPKNVFKFVTENFAKRWKMLFPRFRTFVFDFEVA